MASNSQKMGKKEPSAASNYATGTSPKDVTAILPVKARMVQNVLLIWLDANIDVDNSKDCRNVVLQLQRVVSSVKTFTDGDRFKSFLLEMNGEKVCMIISGSLGKQIVPLVHDLSQVDCIFILCGNKTQHEQWVKEWPKIKGVFVKITPICQALKETVYHCEQNSLPISFMATSGAADISKKRLNQLDCSFMYTQILKEILLTIPFEQQHFNDFIEFCRHEITIDTEVVNVEKLKREYRDQTPIWWYTFDCFLYRMLNRALWVMDIDMVIKMGFFVKDLHHHIEQLYKKQFGSGHTGDSFTVYRGHCLHTTAFNQMQEIKGGLLSFNNFLSISKDPNVSMNFARWALSNADSVGVLFVMKINPLISRTPFALVSDVSYFKKKEEEVLFSMHTVFRIDDIKHIPENERLWKVELTLTSAQDPDLRALTDRIRKETSPNEKGWSRLGLLLLKLGRSDKAQELYEVMLEQTSSDGGKAPIYHHLGLVKSDLGEYEESIKFYGKALEIFQKSLPSNHSRLATVHNNIGGVYDRMQDYAKALSHYEKALNIQHKLLPTN